MGKGSKDEIICGRERGNHEKEGEGKDQSHPNKNGVYGFACKLFLHIRTHTVNHSGVNNVE